MKENRSGGLSDAHVNEDTSRDESETTLLRLSDVADVLGSGNIEKTGLDSMESSTSGDDEALTIRTKKRVQRFSDSESEAETGICTNSKPQVESDESNHSLHQSIPHTSRIKKMSSSETDSSSDTNNTFNELDPTSRIKNKQKKLKQKFKFLHTSRVTKDTVVASDQSDTKNSGDERNALEHSGDEESSIQKIREIIKEKTMALKSTLYDPDTSDEEVNVKIKPAQKKGRKSTKLTSPKPIRMSAKQAMENMQKIKSESNRMLREKDVSLPYHRPKALSLKDIMSRRRPAVSADGKALPIKMNEEQLKQYVQHLEQRQKEVIELCKSESEEEAEENENGDNISSLNDTLYDELGHTETKLDTNVTDDQQPEDNLNPIDANKTDEVVPEENVKTDSLLLDFDLTKSELSDHGQDKIYSETIVTVNKECKMSIDTELKDLQSKNRENCDVNNSTEMDLVYNDSVGEINDKSAGKNTVNNEDLEYQVAAQNSNSTEAESQLISLHYNSEKTDINLGEVFPAENSIEDSNIDTSVVQNLNINKACVTNDTGKVSLENMEKDFSDQEIDFEDIDALIENAEIIAGQNTSENLNSPRLINAPLNSNPKLTGAPGMVIDLDGTDPLKKLTGVELLKERFIYFAKLKTPEEMARQREKTVKPGTQHLKLKQDLEEQIAEQRSLEWAKRLENEKQHQKEIDAVMGDGSDAEEDIDKIEAKVEEKDEPVDNESSSVSEEEDELEQEIKEKPRKRNPMVDDEAEESDCDELEAKNYIHVEGETDAGNDADDDNEDDESEEESSEESEESESEQRKPKKGRILKVFEDSDDDEAAQLLNEGANEKKTDGEKDVDTAPLRSQAIKDTQDDDIQLAQEHKAFSDDLFTSQESHTKLTHEKITLTNNIEDKNEDDLGTQTFSILETTVGKSIQMNFSLSDKLIASNTQSYDDNLDAAVGLCSGRFSQTQNLVTPTQTQSSEIIGDDVLALCTGQFYDNQFVSQDSLNAEIDKDDFICINTDKEMTLKGPLDVEALSNSRYSNMLGDYINTKKYADLELESDTITLTNDNEHAEVQKKIEDSNLKSILDELNDPVPDAPKRNKYFADNDAKDQANKVNVANTQLKKKFIIDSDDEGTEKVLTDIKKLKIKKKKMQKRALQISDDEEDLDQEEMEEFESDKEDGDGEQLLEYDDEENEVVVKPENLKKKRKAADFFENEAELTSEDEWVGSGDEDERGLDRMEREAGDDDTFNQNALQRELGQIHMRDVLDQDKREVRLIQELLFEDGDLGDGHRQRKFKWRDADGEEGTGIPYNELPDTQEEEFESEEQWRKQRHEREMFLKSLKNQDEPEEALNISVNRTSIIKANLSKSTSSMFVEINTCIEKNDAPLIETKTAKDIPSPKKQFALIQQNYHSSLLTRGRGALARLAALATPLANDDDTPHVGSLKPTHNRNFVFTALETKEQEDKPKVTKRKAEKNVGTPRLVKKMRTDENQKIPKSSLLDHIKT